jgi:hypothetical protein
MSRRRRRSGSGSGGGNAPGQQSQSNRSRHQNHQNQQNQQNQPKGAAAIEAFWGAEPDADGGEAGASELQVERIRPTLDPAALPRSLGDPPLTPDTAAAHHVAVVYEEAVRAATALAAANGLLDDPTD